jgi:hypothetical protein
VLVSDFLTLPSASTNSWFRRQPWFLKQLPSSLVWFADGKLAIVEIPEVAEAARAHGQAPRRVSFTGA